MRYFTQFPINFPTLGWRGNSEIDLTFIYSQSEASYHSFHEDKTSTATVEMKSDEKGTARGTVWPCLSSFHNFFPFWFATGKSQMKLPVSDGCGKNFMAWAPAEQAFFSYQDKASPLFTFIYPGSSSQLTSWSSAAAWMKTLGCRCHVKRAALQTSSRSRWSRVTSVALGKSLVLLIFSLLYRMDIYPTSSGLVGKLHKFVWTMCVANMWDVPYIQ